MRGEHKALPPPPRPPPPPGGGGEKDGPPPPAGGGGGRAGPPPGGWARAAWARAGRAPAAGACPYADSANAGSRLAVVDAVVDHGTLAIDASVFVAVPPADAPPEQQPYVIPRYEDLEDGTLDRIRVGGRFYSDKPYTPSLYL